jgi:DNA polymerase-3 subunit epsilon
MYRAPAGTKTSFAAIDFETADYQRDSACAVAIVRVEDGQIIKRIHRLIRPPRRDFVFSYIHGIYWADVVGEPSFAELWPSLKAELDDVEFLAAHNASFDRSVLAACCERARIRLPRVEFKCTMQLARARWQIYPTKLPDVCERLGIPLRHHEPLSDAEACARIVIAAEAGHTFSAPEAAQSGHPPGVLPRSFETPRKGPR